MIVKQKYAGWVGVILDGIVCNGSISFEVKQFGTRQFEEYKPTMAEVKKIIKMAKEYRPLNWQNTVKYLELKYNITHTHEERIADIKLERFRKDGTK